MIRIILFWLLSCKALPAICQYSPSHLSEFFFGRQPSARAEAMGRGYMAVDGDLGSIYFNAAGVASVTQPTVNITYTSPGYYMTRGFYYSWALNYKIHKYLQIAASQFRFDFGKTVVANATKTPYSQRFVLNASSEPIKKLLVGINANYFTWHPGIDKAYNNLFLDFGVIKKISFTDENAASNHTLSLGSSIQNLNYASTRATFDNVTNDYDLPVILRAGISYKYKGKQLYLLDSVPIVNATFQAGYQTLLNSEYRSGIQVGGEVTFLNLISLRAGHYNENVYDYNLPENNRNNIAAFTYGLGVIIPTRSLLKIPVDIKFDYTNLPQVNYSKVLPQPDNFNTIGLSIVYKPIKRKP